MLILIIANLISISAGADVNSNIKSTAQTQELQQKQAEVLVQPMPESTLELENNKRREVFLSDDYETMPSFENTSGLTGRQPYVAQDPTQQIYSKTFEKKQAEAIKKNYRRALSIQYSENLKQAQLPPPKRDLATELDFLERQQKFKGGAGP